MEILVYVTTASEKEAETIAEFLIKQKLAACVNIIPKTKSIYYWDNKIQKAEEAILLAKTTENIFDLLQKKVNELHSYETPCIIAIPITKGSNDFLAWIKKTLED